MRSRLFLFVCSLSLLCWVTLLFVGCQKEDGAKRFSIFTESYRGTAKVVVDGLSSSWRAGDGIWVNGEQGSVALDNNGAPILDVSVTNWEYGYYASYPASSVVAGARDGTLTLTLPQAYQYREDATTHKQLLEMPMVAYTVNDRLEFKHLTGALVVEVPHVTRDIVLDYIMVRSSTSPLSGTGTVDVRAENPQVVFESDTTHTVVMYFDRCPVTIANSESPKSIMIPIAPTTGNDHKFTVTVCAHSHYTPLEFFFFNKESNAGNLMRNEVAVAPVPVDKFTSTDIPLVGSGTPASPYLIQNKGDYKNFLKILTYDKGRDKCYTLVNDIDFGGDTVTSVTYQYGFYGNFNGNSKQLKNVKVEGTKYNTDYYISLFPCIIGGEVEGLSVVNVRLLTPSGGYCRYLFVGGMSSYVQSASNGVVINNIQVSNMTFGLAHGMVTVSDKKVAVGGVVGGLTENQSGRLTMESCQFIQPSVKVFSDSVGSSILYFGGMIGDANGADVILKNCHVGFGGTQSEIGTNVKTACAHSYVGSAIGSASNNLVQIDDCLLLEGHLLFIGTPNDYVKKIIGRTSNFSISFESGSRIDMTNLFFWKQSNPGGSISEVTNLY